MKTGPRGRKEKGKRKKEKERTQYFSKCGKSDCASNCASNLRQTLMSPVAPHLLVRVHTDTQESDQATIIKPSDSLTPTDQAETVLG